jgi:hypothetical protein
MRTFIVKMRKDCISLIHPEPKRRVSSPDKFIQRPTYMPAASVNADFIISCYLPAWYIWVAGGASNRWGDCGCAFPVSPHTSILKLPTDFVLTQDGPLGGFGI